MRTRSLKPALLLIFLTLLLDVLGIGLIIPVAPKLVEQLIAPSVAAHDPAGAPAPATQSETRLAAAAAPYVAYLGATYALMQLLFSPLLGTLSDRFGRRPVLLFALFGSGLDYLALSISPNLTWLFVTRAINGLTGASMTVANAYVADVTPPEKRAVGFGMMGAAFGLGFVLGPLMGGWLGAYNIRLPFIAAGILTLLNWLYGLFILPESLPPERRRAVTWSRTNPVGAFAWLARYPIVFGMAMSLFLVNMAQFGLHATWVLYTGHRYGWGPPEVGYSLTAVGVGAAIVQGGLARKLIPAIGERRALMLGMALSVCAYIGYGLATRGWMIYAVIGIGTLAGIGQPAGQAIISKAVRPDEQGAVQGALTALQMIAVIFGSILGASAFSYAISGHAVPFLGHPGLSFFVGALLAALGWVAAGWAISRHGPASAEASSAPTSSSAATPADGPG